MPDAVAVQDQAAPALRRELGLRDLTLFAIACIVGTRWIASAAHAGPGSVTLWLVTTALFVVPLAVAVAALTVKYPGVGGLYLWTRGDFGPWPGFLCFWVYWMGIAFWFPSAAMFYMKMAVYTFGQNYQHLAENRIFLVILALAAIWIALGANMIGLKVGKWIQNLGGAATWVLGGLLATLAVLVWMKRGSATAINLIPQWNRDTINAWATIAYALTGLELVGMMGAEIRNPRSVVGGIGQTVGECAKGADARGIRHAHRHQLGAPRDAGDADAVITQRRNDAGDHRAVSVDVRRVAVVIVEVPAGDQLPDQIGMRRIDAAIQNGDRHARSDRGVPCDRCVDRLQMPFAAIVRVVWHEGRCDQPIDFGELDIRMVGRCVGYRLLGRCGRKRDDVNIQVAQAPDCLAALRRKRLVEFGVGKSRARLDEDVALDPGGRWLASVRGLRGMSG